jgi:hypothetical protein
MPTFKAQRSVNMPVSVPMKTYGTIRTKAGQAAHAQIVSHRLDVARGSPGKPNLHAG